jgi:predicted metal-binding protein
MTKMKREELEPLFAQHEVADFKWISPRSDIIVSPWVRMKCIYGCDDYGRNASCPPNTPSLAECAAFFHDYETGTLMHFPHRVDKPEDRRPWSRQMNQGLLKLERDVFLAGFPKAFLLFMDCCRLCAECPGGRAECRNPLSARPSPEGMAVDVFGTVRQAGYPISVLTDYDQEMNRYAFLLIE